MAATEFGLDFELNGGGKTISMWALAMAAKATRALMTVVESMLIAVWYSGLLKYSCVY